MTAAAHRALPLLPLLLMLLASSPATTAKAESPARPTPDTVDFNRDVRRVLSENCFGCHGPDAKPPKAGRKPVRLDLPESTLADHDGRRAVVPGHPEQSELFRRITTPDPDDHMPPPDSGKKLGEDDIALLRRWIEQGAVYARHWAYVPPRRTAPTTVRQAAWPRNSIDRFILARLEREGLTPAPEADGLALIRRSALDLTGLPPSLGEVDRFATDDGPDAYERWVDRLLRKESYGEHWARLWLDLARYADSSGYADDPARTIWAYRDYVIRSFNANKPFDQFTLEQLAGDLLENPTDDQLTATAFHRNTMTNNEGGTSDEEFRNVAVIDRVNTTMAVWMGTTMACAQCHNHKYDPISQEDYFRLFAVLNNTADADRSDETPVLPLFTPEQKRQKKAWETGLAQLEKILQTSTPELVREQSRWERTFASDPTWQTFTPAVVKASSGAKVQREPDGIYRVSRAGKTDVYTIEIPMRANESFTALRLEVLPDGEPPNGGVGHAEGNFVLSRFQAALTPGAESGTNGARPVAFAVATADFAQKEFEAASVLDNKDPKNRGWAIAPKFSERHFLTLVPESPVRCGPGSSLVVTLEQASRVEYATIARLRLSRSADPRAPAFARTPPEIVALIRKEAEKRTAAQRATVAAHYRSIAPRLRLQRNEVAMLKKKIDDTKPYSTVPICRELAGEQRRKTNVQRRGNFLDLGREVSPGLPAAFQPEPAVAAIDRRVLARWLGDTNNPLTARVVVNRMWESIFGIGLVRTSEEFGAQGELPSHPELLDWLAMELMDSGWDLKHVLRLMVTSAAYRQSSRVTPDLVARDPDNRLLARGPRFRLTAEMIRDQALFVSGLLSPRLYGAPVKPQQPKLGLSAAFGSATDWETSAGENRYRRALYTTWRRSNPYPSMSTFDAPNREVCLVRRERSNTPLQALVTLNDPVYVEAAQALARRMAAVGSTPAEHARHGFRLCLSRPPTDEELTTMVGLYMRARERFDQDRVKARTFAGKPAEDRAADTHAHATAGAHTSVNTSPNTDASAAEDAAWTVVANVLLNLDEVLMKR